MALLRAIHYCYVSLTDSFVAWMIQEDVMTAEDESRMRAIAEGLDAKGLRKKIPHLRLSPAELAFLESIVADLDKEESRQARREKLRQYYRDFSIEQLEKLMEGLLADEDHQLEREAAMEVMKELKRAEAEAKKKEKEDVALAKRVESGRVTRSIGNVTEVREE